MDTPLLLQVLLPLAATAGGALGMKYFEARKKAKLPEAEPAGPEGRRLTDQIQDLDRRMQEGFSRVENAVSMHTQIKFPALERSVTRIEEAVKDHTGREHEELEARIVTIEGRLRRGAAELAPPKPLAS